MSVTSGQVSCEQCVDSFPRCSTYAPKPILSSTACWNSEMLNSSQTHKLLLLSHSVGFVHRCSRRKPPHTGQPAIGRGRKHKSELSSRLEQTGFLKGVGRSCGIFEQGSLAGGRGAMATDTALDAPIGQSSAPAVQPAVQPPLAPFYDPIDDDENEEWALKQRQGRKSDAVLTCPACLTTLSIDCQRHELYVNQYRAMFVRNCTIVETERLRYSDSKKRKRNARRKRRVEEEDIPVGGPGMIRIDPKDVRVGEEVFKPVRCAECTAEVAVLDGDEVYHFFDAIPTFS